MEDVKCLDVFGSKPPLHSIHVKQMEILSIFSPFQTEEATHIGQPLIRTIAK